ncbi:MAG: glycosyltransferase family 2 protein [Dongiaceae bacterium]
MSPRSRRFRSWKARLVCGLTASLHAIRDRLRRRDPVIHLYCLCWNEARILPFFFRHYDPLVDRYFIFDNGSTDRSLALLAAHPKVTLGQFRTVRGSLIGEAREFYETIWRPSRGVADWVLIVNIDEHLHHPDGAEYFKRCSQRGITAIVATGYEMVAAAFPDAGETLSASITRGVRAGHMDKLCAFRPDAVTHLNYGAGRHKAAPEGRVVYPRNRRLNLLHYKFLGGPYVVDRYAELGARVSDADRERLWGRHYFREPGMILKTHHRLLATASPVPGLCGDSDGHDSAQTLAPAIEADR